MNIRSWYRNLIILAALFILVQSRLCATEYFISNKAGSGVGTPANPFGMGDLPKPEDMYSEGAALSALQPGDTLTFLPGIYELHTSNNTVMGYIRPVRSGTPEKPITFRAVPGGKVVLRSVSGTQGVLGTVKIRGWQDLDNIRFYGFVVECRLPFDKTANPELNGIRLQGRNNEVAWCRFYGERLPTTNNFDGIRIEHAVNARIHHNEITGWQGDHWNSNGIKIYTSDKCVIEDNYIHGNTTGIFEKDSAAGNIYRRNYIAHNVELAFLGSNQTTGGRADAQYYVYENIFDGPVNLLYVSRGIEFHDNLLLNISNSGDDANNGITASGGKVYQTRLWNNVVIAKRTNFAAYAIYNTRWNIAPPDNPLDYCNYNIYDCLPTYRFGRYTGAEDVFNLQQMQGINFEKNTMIVSRITDIYENEKNYKLKLRWRKAGRYHDPVGPDDPAKILDTTRYGPSAMPVSIMKEQPAK